MNNQGPKLDRSLGLGAVVLFGLAYMAPMIVFGTFGVLAAKSEGTAAGAYLVALAAVLLTAYSYGRMASIHPVSGSAYSYTRRSINAHTGFLIVTAFIALAVRYVVLASDAGSLLSVEPFFRPGVPFSATLAGAALAVYSFLGFDAVSTLAEETIEPKKTMPRAIFLIALIGGLIFIGASYVTELAHPSTTFQNEDAAAFEIARKVGGDLFVTVFLVGMVLTQFTAGLSAQASVGRLLYAMGRDRVLPKRVFGYLNRKFRTPVINIAMAGLFGLLALGLDEATSTSFINFGAFTAFTFVNLSVMAHYLRHRGDGERRGVLLWLILPGIGALLDLGLLVSLDSDALILGVVWLTVGVAYLTYLTRFFQVAPPDLDMEAAEETG